MNSVFEIALEALSYWWLAIPLAIFAILKNWYLVAKTEKYIENIDWVLLEISIPKSNLKSAKAMEQVVSALHATYSFGISKWDRYTKGKVEDWMSLEIVGFYDGVYFYIRSPKGYRKLVETALLSEYPDAEITEVEDYTERLKEKPFSDRDVFATDFNLIKGDYLPIRTYDFFEDHAEEKNIDPIATITEVMSTLQKNEALWLQLLIRPTNGKWRDKGEEAMEELLGNKKAKAPSTLSAVAKDVGEVARNLPSAMFSPPAFAEKGDDKPSGGKSTGPAAQDKIKAINNKLSKNAFECILRMVYIDDKNEFTGENITSVMGAIRQLSDHNLNQLAPNSDTLTSKGSVGRVNRAKKLSRRKRMMVINYIERAMPKPIRVPFVDLKLKTSVMNAEEIATIFHPPTEYIKSQKVRAIHSKKGLAPVDLPTKDLK